MLDTVRKTPYSRGIALVGNYLPRVCGIATFTFDLAEAVSKQSGQHQQVIVAAMNDKPEGYAYPERVKFEIRQDYQIDYSRAADFLNFSRIDAVSLQHEYGIFGGEWGSNILTLLRDLNRPLIVTCHTVINNTDPIQREVFLEIAARADRLVVMSHKAVAILEDVYGVKGDKIVYIPHGIHDVPFVDPSFYKDKFRVEGRNVLLTFGLLHRFKGIEYMIEALPSIVEKHPRTTYIILGATHPGIERKEGEAYRLSLQRRVRELGLEENVLFHPRFVDIDELLEYLGASDICVTPYLVTEQITSGALAYAMGSGKAVVSTPYWYAEELLAEGRGRIVPMRDSRALAKTIRDLLDDEIALSAVRKKAYLHCRGMVWSAVARDYLSLFDEVRSHIPQTFPTASAMRRPIASTNLPLPNLDHLIRLCDDTGPAHHAIYTVPDWKHGYHLDDAAMALVVSAKYHDIFGGKESARIADTCLALLQILIGDGTSIDEGLDYRRHRMGTASQTAVGKVIWALGYLMSNGPCVLAPPANDLFHQVLPNADITEPLGAAYAILGAANYLERFPGASGIRRYLSKYAKRLDSDCMEPGWIERWVRADWPLASQALLIAASKLGDGKMREHALQLLKEARERTRDGMLFLKPGENPHEEELPTTAATFIEALGAGYIDSQDPDLLASIRVSADWFLGANRREKSLYDFSTGGCHDAITASGLNSNQGTEATLYCLLAFLTLHHLAGIGLKLKDGKSDDVSAGSREKETSPTAPSGPS